MQKVFGNLAITARQYAILAARTVILLACPLMYSAGSVAQTPLANPNVDLWANGVVNAAATNPIDGSVIVGGNFDAINGQPRGNLAKINADGTLDASWNPIADHPVYGVAIDGSGNVYIGGSFSSINGNALSGLAKLAGSGSGAPVTSWNPAPDGLAFRLASDGLGSIYAAGYFQHIGGQTRNGLAKLSESTGQADAIWNPGPNNNDISALCLDANGDVFVGGNFQTIGGQNRNGLAKLSATGTGAADLTWNPSNITMIDMLAAGSDGNIYVRGLFSHLGGQNNLTKLPSSGTGAADPTWNPQNVDNGGAFVLDGAGHLYTAVAPGSGLISIAKVSTTGTGAADPAWDPGSLVLGYCLYAPCHPANAMAITGTGKLVVGGTIASIGGQPRLGLAAISATDATSQAPINALLPATVSAIAAQPGGGMIVGGKFELADQLSRINLLRLNADGSLDASWNPGADNQISSLVIDGSGTIYVGGAFSSIGGHARYALAKLTSSGSLVTGWAPAIDDGPVATLSLSTSGDLYVGGGFTTVSGGQARNHLAKISASTGAIDATWNPGTDGQVFNLALDDANALLYVSGYFSHVDGTARQYLARISTGGTGALDASWNPSPDGTIGALAVDNIGALFVGGHFSNIGGQQHNNIAKIVSANGSADALWNPSACDVSSIALDGAGALYAGGCSPARFSTTGTGFDASLTIWSPPTDGNIFAIALDTTENVYVGGSFTTIGGKLRANLAALPSDAVFANGFD